ncbi:MAG: GNAT family N-acetyltransferase [Cyanobacteria bacterium P01_E01_bin.42]
MTYTIESEVLSEKIERIFDSDGREYYLKIDRFFYEGGQPNAVYFFLHRCDRNNQVGDAYCCFDSAESLKLADIKISDEEYFESGIDKWFKLTHWNEPTNYQNKTLGSQLLHHIIDFAKHHNIKKISGILECEDRQKQPFLISWYEKHGFNIDAVKNISLILS